MTQRQLSLHDQIIRVSDIFQLGLTAGEQDWFYKFIRRMDENDYWNKEPLVMMSFIKRDFYDEFAYKGEYGSLKQKLVVDNPIKLLELYGFDEAVQLIPSTYDNNLFISFLKATQNLLKDEWVDRNVELFDDSCNPSCRFTYHNRANYRIPPHSENGKFYSPWHYVFQSTSISDELKQKYRDRPTIIKPFDDEPKLEIKDDKTFLQKMFS